MEVHKSNSTGWIKPFLLPVLYYNLFLGVFILSPVFIMIFANIHPGIQASTVISLIGTLVAELAMLGLLLRWLKKEGKSLADLGWGKRTSLVAIMLSVVFAVCYAGWTLRNPWIYPHVFELNGLKFFGITVGIIGAVVEEIVFRGYVLTKLKDANLPVAVQIFISGLAFSLIHMGFNKTGMLLTFAMGMILAFVYVVGRRSLIPSIIGHSLINVLVEPWLLMFIITMYEKLAG